MNIKTLIMGGLFIVMIIGGVVALLSGRSPDSLLPFFGIILAQALAWADAKSDAAAIKENVNGHMAAQTAANTQLTDENIAYAADNAEYHQRYGSLPMQPPTPPVEGSK